MGMQNIDSSLLDYFKSVALETASSLCTDGSEYFHFNVSTCVAYSTQYQDECDSESYVCAGWDSTFGSRSNQFNKLQEVENSQTHPDCPTRNSKMH